MPAEGAAQFNDWTGLEREWEQARTPADVLEAFDESSMDDFNDDETERPDDE